MNDKKELNERNLWYPSRDEFVEDIRHKGIDFTNNLAEGPLGTGKYFFLNATEAHERKASHRYKKNTIAYMFLCNVLAGDMTKVRDARLSYANFPNPFLLELTQTYLNLLEQVKFE